MPMRQMSLAGVAQAFFHGDIYRRESPLARRRIEIYDDISMELPGSGQALLIILRGDMSST